MKIHDLARHLGVSIGTVSRALNDKPDVNPQTRQRVMEAAKALGYEPNQSGRNLRRGLTRTIAFIMEVGVQTSDENAAFFLRLHRGVQSVTEPAGFDYVVLMLPEEQDASAFVLRSIARRQADGYILSATKHEDPRIEMLQDRGIPFVSLGRSSSGHGYDWIDIDFEAIVATSVRLLAKAGHRRIALTLPMDNINYGVLSLASYRRTLAECGLPFDPDLVIRCPLHGGGGYLASKAFLAMEPRPTAILLINALMAEGFYAGMRAENLEPGRDVSVIGHLTIPQNANLVPRLTSYHISIFELGKALGARILSHLPGNPAQALEPFFRDGLWPFEMVLGESHLWTGADAAAIHPGIAERQAAGLS